MKELIIRRFWIDKESCTGFTLCRIEAPGIIAEDEANGVSRIREESLLRTPGELKRLLEAWRMCPMAAFYLETDSGEILNIDESDWAQSAIASGLCRWEK